jgi:hypothetical protein
LTVHDTSSPTGPYLTNGATTSFDFEFCAASADEISILLVNAVGTRVTVPRESYSVTVSSDRTGTVTFVVAPPAGYELYILSQPDFTQEIQINNNAKFLPSVIMEGLDRSVIRDLFLLWMLGRAVLAPENEAGHVLPPRSELEGRYLAGDATGELVGSSGTGADLGLRSDLAAGTGAALSGYNLGLLYSQKQTVAQQLDQSISLLCCVPPHLISPILAGTCEVILSSWFDQARDVARLANSPITVPTRGRGRVDRPLVLTGYGLTPVSLISGGYAWFTTRSAFTFDAGDDGIDGPLFDCRGNYTPPGDPEEFSSGLLLKGFRGRNVSTHPEACAIASERSGGIGASHCHFDIWAIGWNLGSETISGFSEQVTFAREGGDKPHTLGEAAFKGGARHFRITGGRAFAFKIGADIAGDSWRIDHLNTEYCPLVIRHGVVSNLTVITGHSERFDCYLTNSADPPINLDPESEDVTYPDWADVLNNDGAVTLGCVTIIDPHNTTAGAQGSNAIVIRPSPQFQYNLVIMGGAHDGTPNAIAGSSFVPGHRAPLPSGTSVVGINTGSLDIVVPPDDAYSFSAIIGGPNRSHYSSAGRYRRLVTDTGIRSTEANGAGVDFFTNGVRVHAFNVVRLWSDAVGRGWEYDGSLRPTSDGVDTVGTASNRFNGGHTAVGLTVTSDLDEKVWRGAPTADEVSAARLLMKKIGAFKLKDAIAAKGDDGAREHFGLGAQDVADAFAASGADPFRLGCVGFDMVDGKARMNLRPDELLYLFAYTQQADIQALADRVQALEGAE